jgi:hypothetical protein
MDRTRPCRAGAGQVSCQARAVGVSGFQALVARAIWDPDAASALSALLAAQVARTERDDRLPPLPQGAEQRWLDAVEAQGRWAGGAP